MGLATPRRGRPRGGRADGPGGRLLRDQRPPPARPRPPTPTPTPCPKTPTLGLCDPVALPPPAPCISLPLRPPAPTVGFGPRDADPSLRALICPHPSSAWTGPLPSRIFHQLPRPTPGTLVKGSQGSGCSLCFPEPLGKPRRPLPRAQADLGGRDPGLPPVSVPGGNRPLLIVQFTALGTTPLGKKRTKVSTPSPSIVPFLPLWRGEVPETPENPRMFPNKEPQGTSSREF